MIWSRCAALALCCAFVVADNAYEYYLAGNGADVQRRTSAGLLLSGGGGDVDAGFRWFIDKAGGGDIVVIRASGTDAYNAYIQKLGGVDSIETLVTKSPEAASDKLVVEKIRQAEGLFIAGGDQWNYVRMWKSSPVQDAIHYLAARGAPIGGSSAGLAILGEHSFSAEHDTVHSAEALANPFDQKVTIESNFLNLPNMKSVLTDSHFKARDRMGRLLVFLARIRNARGGAVHGVGIDERTAVLVEPDGAARVAGSGAAYFVTLERNAERCEPGRPLTGGPYTVERVADGGSFNVRRWTSGGAKRYQLMVKNGIVTSSTGALY
jgi:cyanophycinase